MAGVVDILLRLVGDSRDAVRAVDDVGAAADRTTTRTERLSTSLRTVGARIGAIASSAVATVEGLQEVYGRLDQLFNPNRQEDVALASGGFDTARRLRSAEGLRFSDLADPRNLLRTDRPFSGRTAGGDDRVRSAIAALARTNPAQLRDAIPFLPDRLAEYATERLAEAAAAGVYQQSLAPAPRTATAAGAGSPTVIVNQGVGDPNRTGDEVRAALERAQRNNGRYTTTVNRP